MRKSDKRRKIKSRVMENGEKKGRRKKMGGNKRKKSSRQGRKIDTVSVFRWPNVTVI